MGLQTSENTFGAADKFTRAGNLDYFSRAEGVAKLFPNLSALNTWLGEEQARQRLGAGFGVVTDGEAVRVANEPPAFSRRITLAGTGTGIVINANTVVMPNGNTFTLANNAARIFDGTGTPSGALGANNDIYYERDRLILWLKSGGTWAESQPLFGTQGVSGLVTVFLINLQDQRQALADAAALAFADGKAVRVIGQGATISSTLTWPAQVPLLGEGPGGYARIRTLITNGTPTIDLALNERHYIEGLWIESPTLTNTVGFRAGRYLEVRTPGETVPPGARRKIGLWVYTTVAGGTCDTNRIVGTGSDITDGSVLWTVDTPSSAGAWAEANDTSYSHFRVRVDNCAVGIEQCGWENNGFLWVRGCTEGIQAHHWNAGNVELRLENCVRPMRLHTAKGLRLQQWLIQGDRQTQPALIDNADLEAQIYWECATTFTQAVPFASFGTRERVDSLTLGGNVQNLNEGTPYFLLDEVGVATGAIQIYGAYAANSDPYTSTNLAGSVDLRVTSLDQLGRQIDVRPRFVEARNLWPNPDCQSLVGPDRIILPGSPRRCDVTINTADNDDSIGDACIEVVPVAGQTGCYTQLQLRNTDLLASLAGKRITVAALVKPFEQGKAAGAKTVYQSMGVGFVAAQLAAAEYSAIAMRCQEWNVIGLELDVPATPEFIGPIFWARRSGTAVAGDRLLVQQIWLAEGNKLQAIKRGHYLPTDRTFRREGFRNVWRADTYFANAGNWVRFTQGDIIERSDKSRLVCTVGGNTTDLARFVYSGEPVLRSITTTDATATTLTLASFDATRVTRARIALKLTASANATPWAGKTFQLLLLVVWNGPGNQGSIAVNGGATSALGASNTATLLLENGALAIADPTVTLAANALTLNFAGIAATTIDWVAGTEIHGGW